MTKHILDCNIDENIHINHNYNLLKLSPANGTNLPEMLPGQFAQVEIKDSVDLRRPISICNMDREHNQLWLLVRKAGKGTSALINYECNTIINLVLPLGNSFSYPENKKERILLIGGGVGVAPMLNWGKTLKEKGFNPIFLLGAKSKQDLLLLNEFESVGDVYISTDDGSMGEKGFITQNSILESNSFNMISCCGPLPMMKAISKIANDHNVECEVSLENLMACGIGACLCCVEDTKKKGHVCVCTEGPIFNTKVLKW